MRWCGLTPIVEAFQAMRGVAFVAAVTVVAEVGDFIRFDNPRQVMAYLGLTPPISVPQGRRDMLNVRRKTRTRFPHHQLFDPQAPPESGVN